MPPGRVYECLNCAEYFQLSLTHLDPEYCYDECRKVDTEQIVADTITGEDAANAEARETARAILASVSSGGFSMRMPLASEQKKEK